MKNKSRIEKLEKAVNPKEIHIPCLCELYPNYKGCRCKEFMSQSKADERVPTLRDFHQVQKSM